MKRMVFATLSILSLLLCLTVPLLRFFEIVNAGEFKIYFLLASIGWFVWASLWNWFKTKGRREQKDAR